MNAPQPPFGDDAAAPRQLPYDVEVEQALIGALLVDPARHPKAASLKVEHFYDPLHQRLYRTMLDMQARNLVATPLTLASFMHGDEGFIEVGGQKYLTTMVHAASAMPNVKDYARILADLAIRRELIRIAEDIADRAFGAPIDLAPSAQVEEAERALRTITTNDNAGRVQLIPFHAIQPSRDRPHLVTGLIPRVGITVVWGPPKCGKSFWVLDLMMHACLGWLYRGLRVHPGPVIYCAFEGQAGLRTRVAAFRQRYLDADAAVPFFLQPAGLDLIAEHGALIAAIRSQSVVPVAVVLDTLNQSLVGSESDDEDMSAYVRAAGAIRDAFNCAVIVVHHCGYDDKRMRGFSGLPAAIDCQLSVKRDEQDNIIVECKAAKDMAAGASTTSRLEVVEVGQDEDGQPITSCVIVPDDGAVSSNKRERVTGAAKTALDLLRRAIIDCGEDAPPSNHIPSKSRTTRLPVWRAYCDQGTVTESDEPDSRRKAFVRATTKLQALGLIGVWGEFVWLT